MFFGYVNLFFGGLKIFISVNEKQWLHEISRIVVVGFTKSTELFIKRGKMVSFGGIEKLVWGIFSSPFRQGPFLGLLIQN